MTRSDLGNYVKPEINEYDLPIVPIMIHPQDCEGPEFSRAMIDDLWESQDVAAMWAVQTIAELYAMYVKATDKLGDIDKILRK